MNLFLDFNLAIAHGISDGGVYTGQVLMNRESFSAPKFDRDVYFTATYHCGQGPGGSDINLGDVYRGIMRVVSKGDTHPDRSGP